MIIEFVNKVVSPRSKKRILVAVVDLFEMECLIKFDLISLSSLIIEHIFKVVHVKKGRHGIPYGYFLNKLFDNFDIIGEKETPVTAKKMFTLNTLIENECIK